MKRWSLSQVYHSTVTGGQPRSALRASFDIVTATKTFASEAEVVLVTSGHSALPLHALTLTSHCR